MIYYHWVSTTPIWQYLQALKCFQHSCLLVSTRRTVSGLRHQPATIRRFLHSCISSWFFSKRSLSAFREFNQQYRSVSSKNIDPTVDMGCEGFHYLGTLKNRHTLVISYTIYIPRNIVWDLILELLNLFDATPKVLRNTKYWPNKFDRLYCLVCGFIP